MSPQIYNPRSVRAIDGHPQCAVAAALTHCAWNLCSSDAEESYTRSRFSGRFLSPKVEHAFHEWNADRLRPRHCILFMSAFVAFTLGSVVGIINEHTLKTQ